MFSSHRNTDDEISGLQQLQLREYNVISVRSDQSRSTTGEDSVSLLRWICSEAAAATVRAGKPGRAKERCARPARFRRCRSSVYATLSAVIYDPVSSAFCFKPYAADGTLPPATDYESVSRSYHRIIFVAGADRSQSDSGNRPGKRHMQCTSSSCCVD